jgi:hypothetical protein
MLCEQHFPYLATMSSAMPTGLVTTPLRAPADLGLLSSPLPLLSVEPNISMPPANVAAVAPSSDDEVTTVCNLLLALQTGPQVPPLPPSGCYGPMVISSAISDSLGAAAAEAVEAAARELGDKPVKVLLPWYPLHPGTGFFDHRRPAKVSVS